LIIKKPLTEGLLIYANTYFVMPGVATAYSPSSLGIVGGAAFQSYTLGCRLMPELIALSHSII
jgi:hypothetical protein